MKETNRLSITTSIKTGGKSATIYYPDMLWHFASFKNIQQLGKFLETLGIDFTITGKEERHTTKDGDTICFYPLSHNLVDNNEGGFWKRSDVPEDATPLLMLSNGSIVTGYFTNDGETVRFFRPNPNAKEVYQPLPIEEHIAYNKEYGTY